MTFLEAAERVLKDAGEPLHYSEITDRAMAAGYIQTSGATPAMTMGSQLYVAVKKGERGGKPAPFDAVGKGVFALAPTVRVGRLDEEIAKSNTSVGDDLLSFLREMEPREVELLVGQLLDTLGYEEVEVTDFVGDGGIDVTAVLTAGGVTSVSTAVQVKRHEKAVGGSVVQQLRGALATDQRGLIITTGKFSPQAIAEAKAPGKLPIGLVDGARFVELLTETGIGVKSRSVDVLELDLEALVFPEEEVSTRSSALWPLPGGQQNFFPTLLVFLDEVGDAGSTLDQMIAWTIENFEKVSKEGLVKSYLRSVLYSMGLIRFDGEAVLLTELGARLKKERSAACLAQILREQILGIVEIEEILSDGPASIATVHENLNLAIGKAWETEHQTRFRLQWMLAAGLVHKDGKGWALAAG